MKLTNGELAVVQMALDDFILKESASLERYTQKEESSITGDRTKSQIIECIENRLERAKTALKKMNEVT
ncbi:hypothetical protein [Paenibacillus periandrae]|uniref:hypothetical protein n=1 Tax=Paenibacillus periandrae TaxID=1761741 RepID=UPI001F094473|nr:hypothetical protein [Paenibacillus periandrae]